MSESADLPLAINAADPPAPVSVVPARAGNGIVGAWPEVPEPAEPRPRWSRRVALLVVALWALAFSLWFGWLAVQRHQAFQSHAEDLGFTDQIVWNTLHGRPFEFSVYERADFTLDVDLAKLKRPDSLLAFHVEPLLLLVAPLYLAWSDPRTLLILQALGIGLGAFAAHALGRSRLGEAGGLAFAAVYLLAPPLHWAALADFHTVALAAPLLVWMAAAARARRWRWFLLAGTLATATKEEVGLIVALLALAFWRREQGGRAVLALATLGFGWSLASLAILRYFTGGVVSPFLVRYASLGATVPEIARNLILAPGRFVDQLTRPLAVSYLQTLLLWSGGLPLLAPLALVAALPSTLLNTLSDSIWMAAGRAHYSAAVAGALLVAAVLGVERLAVWLTAATALPRLAAGRAALPESAAGWARRLALAPALLGAVAASWQAGMLPGAPGAAIPRVGPHEQLAARFLSQVPPDVPVSASTTLLPHLSERPSIYLFPTLRDAEYVLIDASAPPAPVTLGDARARVQDLLESGEYGVQDAADGYLLLRRGAQGSSLPPAFLTFVRGDGGLPAQPGWRPLNRTFEGGITLLGARLWQTGEVGLSGPLWDLELAWRADAPPPEDVRPFVQALQGPEVIWESDEEVPTLWWYPSTLWRVGETVRTRVFRLPPELTAVRVWLLHAGDDWSPAAAIPARNGGPPSVELPRPD